MKKVTTVSLVEMKSQGEKIAALTAYDYLMASLLDECDMDVILVGDSLGTVVAGHETTLPVTMEQMIYHTQMVRRGVKHALLVADMPFMSFQISPENAVENAGRLMQQGGAEAVKIEGGTEMAKTVLHCIDCGIPVMGHLGLTPQSIHKFGGYVLQGKTDKTADEILQSAKDLEQAGVFAIVLEKIPAQLAKKITESISVPTIGIGAGLDCDGQILVTHDILGLFEAFKPKFARRYAHLADEMRKAFSNYKEDVRARNFPNEKESF